MGISVQAPPTSEEIFCVHYASQLMGKEPVPLNSSKQFRFSIMADPSNILSGENGYPNHVCLDLNML